MPGETDPDRRVVIAELRHLADKPTDFSFAKISSVAAMAAEMLSPPQRPTPLPRSPAIEGQRSIHDEDPGVIHLKGRPSVYQ